MLALMFIAGMAWTVYQARRYEYAFTPGNNQTQSQIVEAALVELEAGSMDNEVEPLLAQLDLSGHEDQLSADLLNADGFAFRPQRPEQQPAASETQASETRSGAAAEADDARADTGGGGGDEVEHRPPITGLVLETTLIGPSSSAMISGNLVRRGGTVEGWTIAEIHADWMLLEYKGFKRELFMEQERGSIGH